MGEDNNYKRRDVLKGVGVTTITSAAAFTTTTSATESRNRRVVRGRQRKEYVAEAEVALRESDEHATVRATLNRRGYEIDGEDALVVNVNDGDDRMTNVFLPLIDVDSGATIGDFGTAPQNSRQNRNHGAHHNAMEETPTLGHFVWSNTDTKENYVIREGAATDLVAGLEFIDSELAETSGSGLELIGHNEHSIELHTSTAAEASVSSESTTAKAEFTSIDVGSETVSRETVTVGTEPSSNPVSTQDLVSCPDSRSTILQHVAASGATCGACGSVLSGNLLGVLACIGCAGALCGYGCCLGRVLGSAECATVSTVVSLGGLVYSSAEIQGAKCVEDGCEEKTCFI